MRLLLLLLFICFIEVMIAYCFIQLWFAKNNKYREESKKFIQYYNTTMKWLEVSQAGKSISDYLSEQNVHSVAVYGIKGMGSLLCDELKKSDISIKYVIDRDADTIFSDYKIVLPSEAGDDVDAIIVTPVYYFEEIKNSLEKKVSVPIYSLQDLLNILSL